MAQPAAQFQSRVLVRAVPMASMRTFNNAALANGATLTADFDICTAVVDRNFFLVGASPSATAIQAIGPYLDAVVFSNQIGTLETFMAVDDSCSFRLLDTQPVAASDLTEISGLRITARYVRVRFTNTSGVASATEFGVYVRST